VEPLAIKKGWTNLVELDVANGKLDRPSNKMDSRLQSLGDWYRNLSPEVQQVLLCLVTFRGFVHRGMFGNYAEALQKLEGLQNYPLGQLDAAVQAAIAGGWLASLFAEDPQLLSIQPDFSLFLKTKLDQQAPATREALQEGFKHFYLGLAESYQQLMHSKDAQERQLGIFFCNLEYENLYYALQLGIEQQNSIAIFGCLSQYFVLIEDKQKALALTAEVDQAIERYPESWKQRHSSQYVDALNLLAYRYLQTKEYAQARQVYQKELQVQTTRGNRYGQARAYHELGMVALEMREYEEARVNYEQAMQIWIEFNDRDNQARAYHELGMVALEMRRYQEARGNYQQALQIKVESRDRDSQALTYHQLGRVALELHEYEQARLNYEQALQIWIESRDRYNQARTCHDLGIVAQALREYEQARFYYEQALQIWAEYHDRDRQAYTHQELGMVALELHDHEQARSHYEQALHIWIEFNDRYNQVRMYSQLGRLAEELGDYPQAQHNYEQALQIWIEFDDRYNQAATYDCLGAIAEVMGDLETAKTNYLLALQISIQLNNQQGLEVSLQNLVRFYQTTQDPSVLHAVAQLFKTPIEQVQDFFKVWEF
jgi:tetratricopeptide (TPR) repeat protein